jgi:hypothetical protein
MRIVADDEWPEDQARSCYEAAWLMREMGLIHEQLGDRPAAQRCFKQAMDRTHQAGDLAYAYFMSEGAFHDGDAIPILPRLVEDLERVGKGVK